MPRTEIGLKIYAGRTFHLPSLSTGIPHLWIAVTEPRGNPEKVVIVSFTTLRDDSDKTLILNINDHPFIRHPTVVHYADARLALIQPIQEYIKTGKSRFDQNCSEDLLERIQSGLLKSTLTRNDVKEYYRKHFEED